MESVVDIVTTAFQAVLAVAVVFTAGYALNDTQDAPLAKVSPIKRREAGVG
jgi:high-affinity nickel permease